MKHRVFNPDAFWALIGEAVCIFLLSLLLGAVKGLPAAGSLIVGGLIALIPAIFFYRRLFATFGARQAQIILKAFYWGGAIKFLMTGIGFVAAFQIPWLQPLWLFVGFLAAHAAFWIGPIVLSLRRQQRMKAHR